MFHITIRNNNCDIDKSNTCVWTVARVHQTPQFFNGIYVQHEILSIVVYIYLKKYDIISGEYMNIIVLFLTAIHIISKVAEKIKLILAALAEDDGAGIVRCNIIFPKICATTSRVFCNRK